MRLLQVPPLLPEHAVDAPADFPGLPLGLALLSAQLVWAPPPFLWVRFGPRACRAPAGARGERAPSRVSSSHRGRGQALPRAPRERFRARAKGILRVPEEQRSQAGAQTHVGAEWGHGEDRRQAQAGTPAPRRDGTAPGPGAGLRPARTKGHGPSLP